MRRKLGFRSMSRHRRRPGDDGSDTLVLCAGDGDDVLTDFTTSGAEVDHIWLAGTNLHTLGEA